jgi:hypothetical protein
VKATLSVLAAALIIVAGLPAFAQTAPPPPPPTDLGSNGGQLNAVLNTDSVNGTVDYTVNFGSNSGQPGAPGQGAGAGGSSGGRGSGPVCTATPITQGVPAGVQIPMIDLVGTQANPPLNSQFTYNGQPLPKLGYIPSSSNEGWSIVVCNGVPNGVVFIGTPGGPGGGAPAAPTPTQLRAVALTASGTIPMPNVTIQHSPNINGVAHLATWFWVTGYDGSPITVTKSALGANLVVKATPTSYSWNFGDGSSTFATTSLGVAWPQTAGDITHTYTQLSTAGFPVSVTFNFSVVYQVNGGPVQPLPPIQRSAGLGFKVGEINTVVVSR